MKISSNVNRSGTRIKFLVALLILAALGSSWVVLRADVPRVASGTWAAAGEVAIPSGAVSVALADGRIVVAGGKSDGMPSSTISTYDPASGAWARVGDLVTARSGHAATVLKDGRVLVAGGTASYGPTFDIEIYDPANGTSVHAGDMTLARVDHAAATLKDGRVLIVGGSDGESPLSLAEIFDLETGQSQGISDVMSTARVRATATAMIDGHVLVVGGNDGTNDLSSAEIFDSATGSFFTTGAMQIARSGHVAVLLPNNNQVLIAGGMSAGAAVASAELYADWRDGFSATPTPMSAARAGGIAGGLQPYDVAFVAGGGANTGEYYGYATVKTDRDDYWPGEPVTVTGSGWQPGETVALTISEDADTHYDFTYSAVADEAGNITNSEFAPIQNEVFQHFGKRFYVTARGVASQALNTFTDGNGTIKGTIRDSVTDAVIVGATITCSNVGPNACNNFVTTTSIANGTYTLTFQFPNNSNTANISVSAPGYATQTQSLAFNNNQTQTINWALVPSITTTTLTVTAASGPYGGNTLSPLTATLTASGILVSGKTISFRLNGASVGTATTDSSGVATLASVSSLAGINASVYSGGVAASFTQDATHAGQTASNTLTVSKKAASVTPTAASKTYGAADPALTGTLDGFLVADGVTASYSRAAGDTVGTYAISATLAPAAVLGNYDVTTNPASFTITKKAASVTPNAAGKTYGAADPALTGTLDGFLTADNVTATYSRTAGETVGAYTISATLSPEGVLANYDVTANTASFDIAKKAASVTPTAASKTYGAADPGFTGTLSGFLAADGVTASYNRTAGETVAGGPYTISATLSPAGVLGNYAITANTASFTIDKAAASVTPNAASKTYGAADLGFTGTLSGFLAADGVTASYSRTAGETVAGAYTISATLSPDGVLANYAVTYNTASFTIDKAVASVTPAAAGKTYGDSDPAFNGTLTGFLAADGVTATYSRAAGHAVGSYAISATLAPAEILGNYAVTYNTASFTIDKAVASVTPAAASKTYGASDPAFTGTLSGFLAADGVTASYSRTAGETVAGGPYTISATLAPTGILDNYAVTYNTASFTIDKAVASVTPAAASKTYGAADPGFTGTLSGFLAADGVTASYSRTAGETVAGGPYTISATLAPTGILDNYAVTYNTASFTIEKAVASVTPNTASKTYGAADPGFTGTLSGFLAADGVTASYSRTAGETVAGAYTISATLSPDRVLANYAVTYNTAGFDIAKKEASVTPAAASKTYGASDPAFTGTLSGFLAADGVTASYSRTAGETVAGAYTISATLSPDGVLANYAVTYNTASFTIDKAVASVTPAAASKTYGASDPAFTGTLSGFLAADGVTASYSRTAGETVAGAYTISATLSPDGVLANYAVTYNTAGFDIAKKAASVTPAAASKTYGASDPAFTGTLSGFLAADGVTASYSRTAGETVAGAYTISATLSPDGVLANYAVTYNTAGFDIAKKAASVTPAAASKTYGATDPAFTGTLSGFLATDGVTASYSRTAGETVAGAYTISATLSPDGVLANYAVTYNTAGFDIAKKAASVTPAAASKTYGATDPAFTGTLSGFLAADGVTASYSRTAGETVAGAYTISATLSPDGVLANYAVTYNTAGFDIAKKAASVTPAAASKTYGASDPAFTGTLSGFLAADGVTASYSRTAGETVAGAYTISATLSPDGVLANYAVTYNTASFTIDKAVASVTPAAASKTYGTSDPAFTGTLSGFLAADGVTASYSRTAGETVAGAYTISATLSPDGVLANYAVTYNTASFTIDKAVASVTPAAASKTYGTSDPAFTGTLSGFLAADGVTASYSRTAGETVADGPYTISATLLPTEILGNYAVTYNTAPFDIAKKAASVTPNAAGKIYGAVDPALTGTPEGLLAADTVTATYSRTAGETVGAYVISAALTPTAVLGNYEIDYKTASFDIAKKAASVTPNAAGKTYGAADPTLTGALEGFLAADTVTATYSRTAGEPVGTYTISAALAPAAVLGNYEIDYKTASFDIAKKAASVTPNAESKTYGAADPVLGGTLDGFLAADNVTATYSRTAGETVDGNPYTISATLSPSGVLGNYEITHKTASFTILYRWDGFLQPINDTAHDVVVMSKFKVGQTIPAKFVLKNAAGAAVQQAGMPTFTRTDRLGACDSVAALENPELVSADTVPLYKWDGAQYHYNWSTKGRTAGLYRIFANLADGTARSVDICLTK